MELELGAHKETDEKDISDKGHDGDVKVWGSNVLAWRQEVIKVLLS